MIFADAVYNLVAYHTKKSQDSNFQVTDRLRKQMINRSASQQEFFNRLPIKILMGSLACLSYQDLFQMAGVNRVMRLCVKDEVLWHQFYHNYFNRNPFRLKKIIYGSIKSIFIAEIFKKQAALEDKIRNDFHDYIRLSKDPLDDPSGDYLDSVSQFRTTWCKNVYQYLRCGGNVHVRIYWGASLSRISSRISLAEIICGVCIQSDKKLLPFSISDSISKQTRYYTPILNFILESPKTKFGNLWEIALNCEALLRQIFERNKKATSILKKKMFYTALFFFKGGNLTERQSMVPFLLGKGADFNVRDLRGFTPLLKACQSFFVQPSNILSIVEADYRHKTLQVCKQVQKFPSALTIRIMEYRGYEDYFQIRTLDKRNILHLLLLNNNDLSEELGSILHETGKKAIFQKDNFGDTPFSIAQERREVNTVNLHLFDNFVERNFHPNVIKKALIACEQQRAQKLQKQQEQQECVQAREQWLNQWFGPYKHSSF